MENYRDLREDFNNYAEPIFNIFGKVFTGDDLAYGMRSEILTSDDDKKIIIEVPGVKKEDIRLTLDKGNLTVSYEMKNPLKEGYKRTYSERSEGKRMRSFHVGQDVKKDNISASLEGGLLTITISKPHVEEDSKVIDIL